MIKPRNLQQIETQITSATAARAVYLLDIRIRDLGGTFQVNTVLKRWPDQAVRWSGSHDGTGLAQQGGQVLSEVATEITRDLAAPGGAITLAEVARIDADARHEKRFACLMGIRRYWRSYEATLRAEAEVCLAEALAGDPEFTSGRAAQAFLAIEDARRATGAERQGLLDRAGSQLTGLHGAGLLVDSARMALAACTGDMVAIRALSTRLLEAYPNNPDVLADVGSKLGLALGDWPKALELEARAMALNPVPDPWYPMATLVKALLDGQPQRAAALMSKAPQRGFQTGQIIRLAVAGAVGDAGLMADARARLSELGIRDRASAQAVIDGECWSDDVKQIVRRGIVTAIPSP